MDISVLRSGSFIVKSANRIYYFRCYKTWESFNSTKSSSKFLYGSPNSRSTLVLWFKLCFSLNGQSWGKRLLSMLGTSIWSRAVDVPKRTVPRLASLDWGNWTTSSSRHLSTAASASPPRTLAIAPITPPTGGCPRPDLKSSQFRTPSRHEETLLMFH